MAQKLISQNLKTLSFELLEWKKTALLRDGKFRELLKFLPSDVMDRYAVLEALIIKECLKFTAANARDE